jgi:hypothetical protein
MPPHIVPIVEGHGEEEALPTLLRRFSAECAHEGFIKINPPIRIKAGSFLRDDEYFRKYITLAAAKAVQGDRKGLVFILLDCEDDCPAALGPRLLQNAKAVRADIEYLVVLAYREYESWFIAAAQSLSGVAGLPMDMKAPPDIYAIRGAKEWLGRRMAQKYDPLIHQADFTKRIDFSQASQLKSFRRFRKKFHAYLASVHLRSRSFRVFFGTARTV